MKHYIVKVTCRADIEETWQVHADNPEQAAAIYGEQGEFLSDRVVGDEHDRTVLTVEESS